MYDGVHRAKDVKVPVCLIYGMTKGSLGINKKVTLGFYATLEDDE